MKQLKNTFEKMGPPTHKRSISNTKVTFGPYQRPIGKSQSKTKIENDRIRSNTLSLARKIESSLGKTKTRDSSSIIKSQLKRPNSQIKSQHPSKSQSHFTSVERDPYKSSYTKLLRKTDVSKPKSQRQELKRIIQSLKQRQTKKIYESLTKKNPSSKTINIKGKSSDNSIHKSVNIELDQPLVMSYSYRTQQGCLATNPSKPNQDSLLIKSKLCGQNIHLFAVADGHGLYGHHVSQFAAKNLSKLLQTSMKSLSPLQSFKLSYNKLQQSLKQSDINAECSGTTLVSVLIKKNNLYCANAGDSRAIIISQNKKKNWQISQLSRDHKPDLPNEKQRILKHGGRIQPFKDQHGNPLGPMRVWLPKQNIQGLAMSRSIGDNVSKTVGVTSQPQIVHYKIQQNDKFVIIGSDGLWQFVQNEQAARLVLPFYKQNKIQQGIDALVKLAHQRWTSEDSSVVDDITVILIFLHK